MGEGSRCFVIADPMQTDLKHEDKAHAFEKITKTFSDEESREMGIRVFEFGEEDIMRSELVKFLAKKLKSIR